MREKATGRWGAATYPAVFAVLEDDLRTVVGQLASGKDADRAADSIRCGGSLQLSTERFKGTAARALGAPVRCSNRCHLRCTSRCRSSGY
jgi:hypothetical protein